MSNPGPRGTDSVLLRLRRLRLLTRGVLLFERVWPAVWPALGVLGAALCVALLDVPRRLPPLLHTVVLAAALLAIGWLAVRGLRAIRLPDDREADRRMERESGLPHRPLAVLTDRPALPGADALWRAHVARAVASVGRLRTGFPRPGLAARDPRALRGALLVALFACVVIAGDEAPSRLARAMVPHFAPPEAAAATEVQGWITPPGYTNLPPVFLRPDGGAVSVPAGSHLTVSLSGGSGQPTITLPAHKLAFAPVDAGSFQADADLSSGGRLAVRRNGGDLAGWDLTVVADAPPVVRWTEPPAAARGGGRTPATRLPWQVSHDYGVTGLQAEIRLHQRPEAPAVVVNIPLPGAAPKSAKGVKVQDLTAHPWAGLAVTGRLAGHDAAGLSGTSADVDFTLPERRFDNPTARALIAVRKTLSLFPDERGPPIGELSRIATLDEVWQSDLGGYLNLRVATFELARNRDPAAVTEVQSRLWQLALHLEEGGAEKTARALAEARQALREVMDAQKRGEKPDPAEIDKRVAALEKAIEDHLQALAEQMKRDPDAQMADPEQQQIDAQDAKRLAEELRQAEQQGKPEAAQQKLAELEKMLDQLQSAHPQHRDAQQKQKQQKRQRGEQQMSALQDIVKREGGILDHAQARGAEVLPPADPMRSFRPTDPAPVDPTSPEAAARRGDERQTDQNIQKALRLALGELMQQSGDLLGQVPPNLGDADIAMHQAIDALGQSRDKQAATAAQAAIEALQKGGQSMSEQMAQQFGTPGDQNGDEEGNQDGDQSGAGVANGDPQGGDPQDGNGHGNRPWSKGTGMGRRDQRTDPFGRPLKEGSSGANESADVALPEQMEQARTRAIQDELRHRGADRSRPQPELDYIDRLLKQF